MIDEINSSGQNIKEINLQRKIKIPAFSKGQKELFPVGSQLTATVLESDSTKTKLLINNKIYTLQPPLDSKKGNILNLVFIDNDEFIITKVSDTKIDPPIFFHKKPLNFLQLLGIADSDKSKLIEFITNRAFKNVPEFKQNDILDSNFPEKIKQFLINATATSSHEELSVLKENLKHNEKIPTLLENIKTFLLSSPRKQQTFKDLSRLEIILERIATKGIDKKESLEKELAKLIQFQSQNLSDLYKKCPALINNGNYSNSLQGLKEFLSFNINQQNSKLVDLFKKINDSIFLTENNELILKEKILASYQEIVKFRMSSPIQTSPLLRVFESRLKLAFYDLILNSSSSVSSNTGNTLLTQNAQQLPTNIIYNDEEKILKVLKEYVTNYLSSPQNITTLNEIEKLFKIDITDLNVPLENILKKFSKENNFNKLRSTQTNDSFKRYEQLKLNLNFEKDFLSSNTFNNTENHLQQPGTILNNLSKIMNIIGEPSFFILPFLLSGQTSFLEVSHSAMESSFKEKEEKNNKTKFQTIKLKISLPKLGSIQISITYNKQEIMFIFNVKNKDSLNLLKKYQEKLFVRLKEMNYDKISLSFRSNTSCTDVIPSWANEIYSDKKWEIA